MLNLEQQNNTTLSPEDLLKHMQSLEKRIKSLEVTNRVILGLFIGTLAAAMTVGAGFAIAAAPIIAGSIVGGILATVALAALGVTAYKYRAEIKAGFKYAADKTVKGAGYTARKIKAGYKHSVDSLKRGAHLVNKRTKEKVSDMAYSAADALYKASGKADYSDKIKRLTQDEIEKSDEIKNDMKEIFADKGNNTELVKGILSGISSKIDLKIAEEAKSGWMEHTSKWQVQKEFINNLNEKSLRSLLTQRSLPKSDYFIDSVFSEHHSEIKEVIKEYKENHLYSSVSNMFNTAEKKANRPSLKGLIRSIQSFHLLERKSPKQPDNSPSHVTSTATVDPARLRSNPPRSFTPKLKEVVPPLIPEGQDTSLEKEWSDFVDGRIEKHKLSASLPPRGLDYLFSPDDFRNTSTKLRKQGYFGGQSGRSSPTQGEKPDYVIIGIEGDDRGLTDFGYYSDSSSGRGSPNSSGSSTPTGRQSLSMKDVEGGNPQAKLRRTNSPYKSEQPSTHMSEQKHTPVNRHLGTLV